MKRSENRTGCYKDKEAGFESHLNTLYSYLQDIVSKASQCQMSEADRNTQKA